MPDAADPSGRVDAVVDLLDERRSPDGTPALALFLELLAERVPAGDDCHQALLAQAARLQQLEEEAQVGESPFQGLRHYDVADADRFFGREALTATLVAHLRRHRRLAVVGASGSGKSSLLRAGLIPALQGNRPLPGDEPPPPGSHQWPLHLITPTARPLAALAQSLLQDLEPELTETARMVERNRLAQALLAGDLTLVEVAERILQKQPPAERLLLVADQFEELFTQCDDEPTRTAFIANLFEAAADGPLVTVIALRADFYHRCADYDSLRQLLAERQVYIGAMSRGELRRAVEEPARRAGWQFEEGLVNRILDDVGNEPGALPLLSHALHETWRRREGRTLTHAGYQAAGAVSGAIASTAEEAYTRLNPAQQAVARNVFLRLTEPGEGTEDTRRRVRREELVPQPEARERVVAVLQQLADARLLTTGREGVEVAHEALIREWPRLRSWLDEDREGLRIHNQLREAAAAWVADGRDASYLYRGVRLAQAQAWAEEHADRLNQQERAFLAASERARRMAQVRRMAAAGAAIVLVIAFLLIYSGLQRSAANQQATAAAELREQVTISAAAQGTAEAAGTLAAANEERAIAEEETAVAAKETAVAGEATTVAEATRAFRAEQGSLAQSLASQGRRLHGEQPLLGLRLALEGLARAPAGSTERDRVGQVVRELAAAGRLRRLATSADELYYATGTGPLSPGRRNLVDDFVAFYDASIAETIIWSLETGELWAGVEGRVDLAWLGPDVDDPFLVVRYEDGPSALYPSATAEPVSLESQVEWAWMSPHASEPYFVIDYEDGSGALYPSPTADPIFLEGQVDRVWMSPHASAPYFVVDYEDGPGALYPSAAAEPVPLDGIVEWVKMGPHAGDPFIIVNYRERPDVLYPSATAEPVPLDGALSGFWLPGADEVEGGVWVSPSAADPFFIVSYRDAPGALFPSATAEPVPLDGLFGDVWMSPYEADPYFVVDYDGRPDAIYHSDIANPIPLEGEVDEVWFSPSASAPFFIVRYLDAPGVLFPSTTAEPVPLAGQVRWVRFSPYATDPRFVVNYQDAPDAVYPSATADPVPLSADLGQEDFVRLDSSRTLGRVWFSPDPSAPFFVVLYADRTGAIYPSATAEPVPLGDDRALDGVWMSPHATAPFFFVIYRDESVTYYPSATAEPIPLEGRVNGLALSPDETNPFLAVIYEDGIVEIGNGRTGTRLAEIGEGAVEAAFEQTGARLIVRHADGVVHLLDVSFLDVLEGKAATMPLDELVRLICTGPLADDLFSDGLSEDLQDLMAGRPLRACQAEE